MNALSFNKFPADASIEAKPYVDLGPLVRLGFDRQPGLACSITKQHSFDCFGTQHTMLMVDVRSEKQVSWFGLEVDVPIGCTLLSVELRIYPAHRIYPRIYYNSNKGNSHIDEPDLPASENFATYVFRPETWEKRIPKSALEERRLAILLPSERWFRLAIREVALNMKTAN